MTTSAKQGMIESAAVLTRERGVEATSLTDILAASGAPRGSIYHHFPGGKAQLIEEATEYAGDVITHALSKALENDDPVAGLQRFAARWRSILTGSDFRAGCTIVAAAVEGNSNPAARRAAASAFFNWQTELAATLRRCGVHEGRSASLATVVVAAVEGGIILARAEGSIKPFEQVVDELVLVLGAAMLGR